MVGGCLNRDNVMKVWHVRALQSALREGRCRVHQRRVYASLASRQYVVYDFPELTPVQSYNMGEAGLLHRIWHGAYLPQA